MDIKKLLSSVLATTMITSTMWMPQASAEVTDLQIWDFEDGVISSEFTQKADVVTSIKESDDFTIGKYFDRTVSVKTWNDHVWTIADLNADKYTNERLEVEFDMYVKNFPSGKYLQFRFLGTGSYPINIRYDGKVQRSTTGGGSAGIKTIGQMPADWNYDSEIEWARYKFVFDKTNYKVNVETTSEVTNENGETETVTTTEAINRRGRKLVGMYVNGVNVLTPDTVAGSDSVNPAENPYIWAKMDSSGNIQDSNSLAFTGFNFCFNSVAGTDITMAIDNLSVVRYNRETDTIPDKSVFITDIRNAAATYEEKYAEYGSNAEYTEVFASYKKSIDEAWVTYNNPEATQEDFDSASAEMNAYTYSFVGSFEPITLFDDDFSNDISSSYFQANDYEILSIDTELGKNDATLGNMIKMETSDSEIWPRFGVNLGDSAIITDDTAASVDGTNAFAEFEFDIKFDGAANKNHAVFLKDQTNRVNVVSIKISSSGAVVYGNHDNTTEYEKTIASAGSFDLTKVNRLKFVIQTTDETGNATQLVHGIYLNGKNLIDEPLPFVNVEAASTAQPKSGTYINRLYFSPGSFVITDTEAGTSDNAVYVDNIKIVKYKKHNATDPSPVKDNFDLVSAIRTKAEEKALINANPDRYTAITERFEVCVEQLAAVYNNENAAEADKKAALDEAKAVSAAMDACNRVALFGEDFENGSSLTGGSSASDTVYNTGNVLKVEDSANAVFDKVYVTDKAASHGQNTFVVTQFDIKAEGVAGNDSAVINAKMQGNGIDSNIISLIGGANPSINLKEGSNNYWYGALEDGNWHTISLVTQITDESSAAVGRNVKLYIDGNNCMLVSSDINGRGILTSESEAYYDTLTFEASGAIAYVDNIAVTKYYGSKYEPVNYAQLAAAIRTGEAKAEKAIAGDNVTADIYNAFNSAIDTAKTAYEAELELTEVEKATDDLWIAYSDFLFENEAYQIGSVNFTDSNGDYAPYITAGGKLTGAAVTKKAEYNYNGMLAAAVYSDDGRLLGVQIADNVLADMETDERKIVPLDIPLTAEDNVVKVMLFADNAGMKPLTAPYVPSDAAATVYVAGDSIVQTYSTSVYPRDGWGAYVGDYYNENVTVNNLAVSGYTLRSYIHMQKMKTVEQNIKPGDYLLISFMANDSSNGSLKRVNEYDYKNMLRLYNNIAIKKGAQAVFVTSPPVMDSKLSNYVNAYNGYANLMRNVAKEVHAPLIDVLQMRADLQAEKGYDYVACAMYLFKTESMKLNFPDYASIITTTKFPTNDKTHINIMGAKKCASWIAEDMKNQDCGLRYLTNGETYEFPEIQYATDDEGNVI